MSLVMVYGTLKQGQIGEPTLRGQKFLGKAATVDARYKMYLHEGKPFTYPCLITVEEGGYRLYGECYDVSQSCLDHLDRFEGVPQGLYKRTMVDVQLASGEMKSGVIVYEFMKDHQGMPHVGQVWPKTDLRNFQFADKVVKRDMVQREVAGLALFEKETERIVAIGETLEQVKDICLPKMKQLGGDEKQPWLESQFELKSHPVTVDRREYSLKSAIYGESPSFVKASELANWATTNSKLFGGDEATTNEWLELIREFEPVVDEDEEN